MSKWSVFWAGVKGFLIPGTSVFEEIAKYGLDLLNNLMSNVGLAGRISAVAETSKWVLDLLVKYQGWCPSKWQAYYIVTINAVKAVAEAFSDAKLTEDEILSVTAQFQIAYAAWMAD